MSNLKSTLLTNGLCSGSDLSHVVGEVAVQSHHSCSIYTFWALTVFLKINMKFRLYRSTLYGIVGRCAYQARICVYGAHAIARHLWNGV
jgi:hypothetical protein